MLTRIAVTNFQVFKERTEIPLAAVNILVGPNSGGKSAVFDALQWIAWMFSTDLSGHRSFSEASDRWRSRLASVDDSKAAITVEVAVNVAPIGDLDRPILALEINTRLAALRDDQALNIDFPLDEGWTGEAGLRVRHRGSDIDSLIISVNGENALSVETDKGELNLTLHSAAFPEFFAEVAECFKVDASIAGVFSAPVWFSEGQFDHHYLEGVEADGEYDRFLVLVANALLALVRKELVLPEVVDADRSVLRCGLDLISSARNDAPESALLDGPTPLEKYRDPASDPVLFRLCSGALAEAERIGRRADEQSSRGYQETVDALRDIFSRSQKNELTEPIHQFVNRHMADSLFLDRGYQIAYEFLPVLPSRESSLNASATLRYWSGEAAASPLKEGAAEAPFAALVNAHLIDQNGTRLLFADVGTGISCVIPVLAALHAERSFIHQPELHLHPALQAALGDVITDRLAAGPCQHFLETHSEHLLLRLLRRVRETHAGKHVAGSSLALTPEQLSVLYFDPQPDGSTRVKRIRVSREGDFIDRWPRGFFEERRRELFDE